MAETTTRAMTSLGAVGVDVNVVVDDGHQGQATTALRHDFDRGSFVAWINQTPALLHGLFLPPPFFHDDDMHHVSVDEFSFRQFGLGQSNPTFLVTWRPRRGRKETPGAVVSFVLRQKPHRVAHGSAHALHREVAVLQAIARHNADARRKRRPFHNHSDDDDDDDAKRGVVPVPRVYAHCTDERVLGTEFYVMEYVEGRIFTDPSLPGMMTNRRKAYESAVTTLAAIHAVDVDKYFTTTTTPSTTITAPHIPFAQRQLDRLAAVSARQAARLQTTVPTELSQLADALRQRYHNDEDDHQQHGRSSGSSTRTRKAPPILTHGDYKIDNLVFHKTRPYVIAVLDWELCSFDGDPLADLANLSLLLCHLPPPPAMAGHGPGGLTGLAPNRVARRRDDDGDDYDANGHDDDDDDLVPHQQRLIALYCRHATNLGVTQQPDRIIRRLPFYIALALYKYAVIVQGVAARVAAGTASSANASHVARQFPQLVRLGIDMLASSSSSSTTSAVLSTEVVTTTLDDRGPVMPRTSRL